jgi:hypothetical protein
VTTKGSKLGELLRLADRWNDWPQGSVEAVTRRLRTLEQGLLDEAAAMVLEAFRPDLCPGESPNSDRVDGRALGPFTFWSTFMPFYRRVAENVPAPAPDTTAPATPEASASGPIILPWRGPREPEVGPPGTPPPPVEFLLSVRGGYLLLNRRYPRREGHKIQAKPTSRAKRLIALALLSHDGFVSTPELLDAREASAPERSRLSKAVSDATNARLKIVGVPAGFTQAVYLSEEGAALARECFPGLASVDLSPFVASELR